MSFYLLCSIANDIVIIRKLCEKETPTQVFFCEICENFKNTYFEEHLQTTASIMGVLHFRESERRIKHSACGQIIP